MENSTFRFVAVSMAVVLLFSCATLDDELPEILEPAGDSIEHEPDVVPVRPELPEAHAEASPTPALPEPPIDITAVRIDDELPRLTPSDAETPVPVDPLPLPELPATRLQTGDPDSDPGPEQPRSAPGPAPGPAPEPAPDDSEETVSGAITAPAPQAAAAPDIARVPESEQTPSVPSASAPAIAETPQPEPRDSAPRPAAERPTEEPGEELPGPAEQAPSDRRDIETGVMTEVNVVFPGFGWVYAGAESGGSGRVEFLRSDRTEDGTVFVFRMTETGRYTLSFQRQDLARGEFVDETVAVTAREGQPVAETEDISPAGDRSAGEAAETGEPVAPTFGLQSPDEPALSVVAAPDVDPRIVFDNALVDGDADRAVAAVRDIPIEMVGGADVVRLARLLDRNGDVVRAIEFYELALSREPFGTDAAEILFALGALYERESDRRSIRRSHGYYERLVAEYPFSRLRDEAGRRAAYLERYFLTIR